MFRAWQESDLGPILGLVFAFEWTVSLFFQDERFLWRFYRRSDPFPKYELTETRAGIAVQLPGRYQQRPQPAE